LIIHDTLEKVGKKMVLITQHQDSPATVKQSH